MTLVPDARRVTRSTPRALPGWLKAAAGAILPARLRDGLRVATGRAIAAHPRMAGLAAIETDDLYEALYEAEGREHPAELAIGGGDFDRLGRVELGALLLEGLRPTDTVVDLGCGTGRLAVQLIPRLDGGHYIGIDIAWTMLRRAAQRVAATFRNPPCRVTWMHRPAPPLPLEPASVDFLCAFSVFTHMEHEDAFRYLRDAARFVRPDGRVILSCLTMDLAQARHVFLRSAAEDVCARWTKVRHMTTSVDLVTAVAGLAGWTPIRWYPGEKPSIRLPDGEGYGDLGQTVGVLARTDHPSSA